MRQKSQRSNPPRNRFPSRGCEPNRPFRHSTPAPGRPAAVLVTAIALAAIVPPLAYGHHPQETGASPGAGFLHPFTGWDHLLAMLAIGIWSGRMGGRALILVPGVFVSFLIAGALFAGFGVGGFVAEAGVLTSVFVLGILAVRAADASVKVAIAWSGFFALFHGYAHGLETPLPPQPDYWLAFLAGTLAIHAAGVGLGLIWQRNRQAVQIPESS